MSFHFSEAGKKIYISPGIFTETVILSMEAPKNYPSLKIDL
jgi:hypothetical protein